MEIKATLNKPYTDVQYADFVVENNHKNGYEIRITEQAAEAWGYTDSELAEQDKQNQIKSLQEQLDVLDLKAIRALRAIQAGTGTEDDTAKLQDLEMQAAQIREQLQELSN